MEAQSLRHRLYRGCGFTLAKVPELNWLRIALSDNLRVSDHTLTY